jgi:hypothetical protein
MSDFDDMQVPGIDYRVEYEYPNGHKVMLLDVEAVELGFCPGCGSFVAGVESDDLSLGQFGMCGECVEELRIETGEYDEPDEDSEGQADLPLTCQACGGTGQDVDLTPCQECDGEGFYYWR